MSSDNDNITPPITKEFLAVWKSLFPGKSLAEVISAIELKPYQQTPKCWSKNSNAPYYQEKYALQIKVLVDWMVANKEPVCLRYEDFDGISRNTLLQRCSQSFTYLIEKMDSTGFYKALRCKISMKKEESGIALYFKEAKNVKDELLFHPIKEQEKQSEWKHKLQDFLDNEKEGIPFKLEGLNLSDEEIFETESSLQGLTNLKFSIKSGKILIVKIPQDKGKEGGVSQ